MTRVIPVPLPDGRVLCPECRREMEAMAYRLLGPPDRESLATYLWWRCPNGHVSHELPLPDSLALSWGTATVSSVMHRGSDGLQPPRVAEPSEDSLRRL